MKSPKSYQIKEGVPCLSHMNRIGGMWYDNAQEDFESIKEYLRFFDITLVDLTIQCNIICITQAIGSSTITHLLHEGEGVFIIHQKGLSLVYKNPERFNTNLVYIIPREFVESNYTEIT